jgi:hypothetical protein
MPENSAARKAKSNSNNEKKERASAEKIPKSLPFW